MSDYYASSQGGGWSADAHLAHYGVLGMKWGQRHFQNKDGTWTESGKRHHQAYEYKSWTTKHNEKKSAKISKKMAKTKSDKKLAKLAEKKARYDYRAKRSKTMDKREQEYANRVSAKGNIAARLLTGSIGTKPYQQYLAMMNAQGKGNTGKKLLAAAAAKQGGRGLSTLVKQAYVRSGEKDAVNAVREQYKKKKNSKR